jgi:hypothetical protein
MLTLRVHLEQIYIGPEINGGKEEHYFDRVTVFLCDAYQIQGVYEEDVLSFLG